MADRAPDDRRKEMIAVNVHQTAFYDGKGPEWVTPANSVGANLWARLRQRVMKAVSPAERQRVYELHKTWLGDLSDSKVLEIGAGRGSPISHHLALTAGEYHAIDLSRNELDAFRSAVGEAGNRHFKVMDFLDPAYDDAGFDVIYAHAVLHHFRYLDVALDLARAKLVPGGRMITYDPLQTWWPVRLLRALFRPFQGDSDWEFPFTGGSLASIESRFSVQDRVGVFNRGKWALVIGAVSPALARRFGDRLFADDLLPASRKRPIRAALHVTYNLRRVD